MQQSLLQFFNQTELKKYVKSTHFEGQFMPYSTLPFLMHWSDHAKVTKALRHEIRHNEKSHEDYNKIVEGLKKLKNSPLWLRLEGKIIQLSVYDLYHNLFITKNFSHEKEYGVSFIGPYGPFTTTKLFDCLNFHTYKNFIYSYLIEGELAQRTFRLQCEQQIILSHHKRKKEGFQNATIKSLSEDGMLVEIDGGANIKDLKEAEKIAFYLSTSELNQTFNGGEKLIGNSKFLYTKELSSSFQFETTDLVFRTSIGNKNEFSHFIFAKYEKSLNENLWPDLLKLTRAASEQVEETLDLAS